MDGFLYDYCVLDVETGIHNRGDDAVGKMKAAPWHIENRIVMLGTSTDVDEGEVFVWEQPIDEINVNHIFNSKMLVGHNIKFDLHYIAQEWPELFYKWVIKGGRVWDTMVVQYLMSGQSKSFPSLDYCSSKYGGTLKDDKIKEYWNNDIDTEMIPKEELMEYLVDDVKNTVKIFENQYALIEENNMFNLVATQMDALLALQEMEANGMYFDTVGASAVAMNLHLDLALLASEAEMFLKKHLPDNMVNDLNVGSAQQVSLVLFGGAVKVINDEPILNADGTQSVYKSGVKKGLPRTKKVKSEVVIRPVIYDPRAFGLSPLKTGHWPTDDEALKKLMRGGGVTRQVLKFITDLLKYREIKKDLTTYYEGFMAHVWWDGKIHANFNQAQTSTGRLSCNQPNLQNITEKDID